MARFRSIALLALSLLGATACGVDAPLAPGAPLPGPASARNFGTGDLNHWLQIVQGRGQPIACQPRNPVYGRAVIGPSGGDMRIGPHRLIIPPGALTQPVEISGTVPEGRTFQIDLQPHGLTFRRPAGLILDVSSCTSVPPIVYLVDNVYPTPPIFAFYSHWWHTVAAPIWHFSRYEIAMREGCQEEVQQDEAREEGMIDACPEAR